MEGAKYLVYGRPLKVTEIHGIEEERRNTTPTETKQTTTTWFSYRLSLHLKLVRAPQSRLVPPPKAYSEDL